MYALLFDVSAVFFAACDALVAVPVVLFVVSAMSCYVVDVPDVLFHMGVILVAIITLLSSSSAAWS